MRERRVQAVLLCQKLGEIFVVVLHFVEFGGVGGAVSFGAKNKAWRKINPTVYGEEKVVQLCNYGEPRILFADRALHVAFLCDRRVRYCLPLPNWLIPSSQQRWLVGNGRTKAARRWKNSQLKPTEVSSEGRTSPDWRRLLCAVRMRRLQERQSHYQIFNSDMGVSALERVTVIIKTSRLPTRCSIPSHPPPHTLN